MMIAIIATTTNSSTNVKPQRVTETRTSLLTKLLPLRDLYMRLRKSYDSGHGAFSGIHHESQAMMIGLPSASIDVDDPKLLPLRDL